MLAAMASLVTMAPSPSGANASTTYVALGDSYASGEGLAPFVASIPSSCDRSPLSYPYEVASAIGATTSGTFVDVACAGARLSDLAGSLDGAAPQGDAVAHGTDVVTLQSGGNDAFFAELATSCLKSASAGTSASMGQAGCDYWVNAAERLLGVTKGSRAILAATLHAPFRSVLESRLLTVIAALRARQGTRDPLANNRTLMAVVDYPLILPPLGAASPSCVVGPGFSYSAQDARTLRAINVLVDQETQRASALYASRHHDAGVFAVDVSGSLSPLSCRIDPGSSDVRAIDLSHPGYSLHPLASGQAKIALAVTVALAARGVVTTASTTSTTSTTGTSLAPGVASAVSPSRAAHRVQPVP